MSFPKDRKFSGYNWILERRYKSNVLIKNLRFGYIDAKGRFKNLGILYREWISQFGWYFKMLELVWKFEMKNWLEFYMFRKSRSRVRICWTVEFELENLFE